MNIAHRVDKTTKGNKMNIKIETKRAGSMEIVTVEVNGEEVVKTDGETVKRCGPLAWRTPEDVKNELRRQLEPLLDDDRMVQHIYLGERELKLLGATDGMITEFNGYQCLKVETNNMPHIDVSWK